MKRAASLVAACLLLATAGVRAQDVLAVAALEGAPGQVRAVPVTVRDVAGTLLDEGDGPGLEIQGFAFRVDFAPAATVTAVTFVQAGVTAGRVPVFPIVSTYPDHIVVLMNFDESTDPLAFALGAPAPGDVVGELRFTIAAAAEPGTLMTLDLDAQGAALVNGPATLEESEANGQLELANGALVVDVSVFADGFESGNLDGWSQHQP